MINRKSAYLGRSGNLCISRLVDRIMAEVERAAAGDEDWSECDDGVVRLILWDGKAMQTYIYQVKAGKIKPSDSRGPYMATVSMSVVTLLGLIPSIPPGMRDTAEIASGQKYVVPGWG